MEGMTDLHTSTRVLTTKVKLDILCSSFASLQGGGIEACHHKERGAITSLKHLIFILTDFYQPSPSSKLILRKRSWRTRAKKRLKRRRNATPSWSRIANWQLRSIMLPWPMLSTPKRIWSSQIVRWVEEFNIWQASPIPQNIWQASPIPKNIWQANPITQNIWQPNPLPQGERDDQAVLWSGFANLGQLCWLGIPPGFIFV